MCFLRRNYAKTISRTVHAFSHTTILVPSTTIPHKRFYHIKSDSLACLNYFSRSNFIVRGKYQLLAYLRNSLSVSFKESTSHQSTNESLPHLYYSTPPPPPPHTRLIYLLSFILLLSFLSCVCLPNGSSIQVLQLRGV